LSTRVANVMLVLTPHVLASHAACLVATGCDPPAQAGLNLGSSLTYAACAQKQYTPMQLQPARLSVCVQPRQRTNPSMRSHLLSSCCKGFEPWAGPLAAAASCTAGGVLAAGAAGGLGAARCCSCCCCCCCSKKAGVSSAAAPAAGEGSGAALGAATGDTLVLGPRCAAVCLCCAALSRPCSPPAPACTTHKQGAEGHRRQNTGQGTEPQPVAELLKHTSASQWACRSANYWLTVPRHCSGSWPALLAA
jgi:hypothetical protein